MLMVWAEEPFYGKAASAHGGNAQGRLLTNKAFKSCNINVPKGGP